MARKKITKQSDSSTEASKIYDDVYGHIAIKEHYKITNRTKSARIEKILADMEFEEKTALRCYCKYKGLSNGINIAAKVSKVSKKKLLKSYKLAKRHMYAPNNIKIAIPRFYKLRKKNQRRLTEYDFDGQKYILNALLKSGIDTKEKLYKHLSLGWYYLCTIPGCGSNARISILSAIDRWRDFKVRVK